MGGGGGVVERCMGSGGGGRGFESNKEPSRPLLSLSPIKQPNHRLISLS